MAKAKSNRQRWNFLAAWLDQLHEAADEGDEMHTALVGIIRMAMSEPMKEMHYELGKLNQWNADLESALAQLDGDGRESPGEDAEPDDDGDNDDDVGWDEPEVERTRVPDRRVPRTVAESGVREIDGRRVDGPREAAVSGRGMKERISRGRQ